MIIRFPVQQSRGYVEPIQRINPQEFNMTSINQTNPTGELRNFKGTAVSLRMSATANSDGISIVEHRMPFGEAPPLHIHRNEDEIFHVLRGRMRFEVGGDTIVANCGDVLVAPKGVAHRFIVESVEGAHCVTIMKGSDFERMVLEMSTPVEAEFMPSLAEPTPAMIEALTAACARHAIEIIGPPLAA